jgi:hypothetical protein
MIMPKECEECAYRKVLDVERCSEYCEICDVNKRNKQQGEIEDG